MSYNIKSQVFDKSMGSIADANIVEITTDGRVNQTRTDADGRFQLSVASKDSKIKISHIGYITEEHVANDAELQYYVQLEDDVQFLDTVTISASKKSSNLWLWIALGVAGLGTIVYMNRDKIKKVKI